MSQSFVYNFVFYIFEKYVLNYRQGKLMEKIHFKGCQGWMSLLT